VIAAATRLFLACSLTAPVSGAKAIDHLAAGEPVPADLLPVRGKGGARALCEPGKVSVFVFFRPGQDHSADALARLAALEEELAQKPVAFAAVVSDSFAPLEVAAAVAAAHIRMPVLVDEGDRLYGKLEVRLYPVVGIAGADGRLVAWEPFRKVNYAEVIRARVLFALGEISAAEVARAVDPPRATMPGDDPRMVARRDLHLGRLLLERGNPAKALESARNALARDPGSAAAHALAGQALAGLGDCAAARAEYEAALGLDPSDADALSGRKAACPKAPP
jgi:tetratricopeptide (TPR) repeat protein